MAIPDFHADGNLPPGVHSCSWDEVEKRFATDPHRQRLLAGFRAMLEKLASAGCGTAYLDGSFVTAKDVPLDFDGLWDMAGVDLQALIAAEPLFWNLSNRRAAQKAKYLGEMFPADFLEGMSGKTFLEFFQVDKDTGLPKGILAIDLRTL